MGWLYAQGYGGAGARFAKTATALSPRRELDGAAAVATGKKQRKKKNDDDGASIQITWLKSSRKLRCGLHRASATPKTATTTPGSKPKIAGHVASAVDTVHPNYRIAIRQNSQITLKFS